MSNENNGSNEGEYVRVAVDSFEKMCFAGSDLAGAMAGASPHVVMDRDAGAVFVGQLEVHLEQFMQALATWKGALG